MTSGSWARQQSQAEGVARSRRVRRDLVASPRVESHLSVSELQELTKEQAGRRSWKRYRAVLLAMQGEAAEQIARDLGCSERSVLQWIGNYNRGGVGALDEQPRPGRPTTLPRAQEQRFLRRLAASKSAPDGPEIRRILHEEFGASYTQQGVYDLLHRLIGTTNPGAKPEPR